MPITKVRTKQQLQVTSDVDFGSLYRVTNLLDPAAAQDAATKAYVDATRTGLDAKQSVRAASTATVTVTYSATGGTSTRGQITAAPNTLDGVTLAANDRILLKDQTTGAQNGIWVVTTLGTGANGVWDRATDFDSDAEVTAGAYVWVEEGTTNADSAWVLTTNNPIIIGGASGTALVWVLFSSASDLIAGDGLQKTGNVINVVGTANRIVVNASTVDIGTDVVTLTGSQTLTNKSIVATQLTGTLQAGQFPALTGDVTTTAGSLATTISANAVTLGKLATLAANSVIGNSTGSTATPTAVPMVTAATASAVAIRDANANIRFNNSIKNLATTATAAGTTTLTVASAYTQQFTGTTTQTVVLPDATTLTVGHSFLITNRSTGVVTVNANGGGLVQAMAASSQVILTLVTNGTAAGTWDAAYSITNAGSGGGTLTTVSIVTANGFQETAVTNRTTTPAISIGTTINAPVLAGNGTAISAATTTGTGSTVVLATTPTISGGSITGLTTFALRDTSAAFDVTIAAVSSTALTAGRTLTLDMVNAARTIKLGGNIDIAGALTTASSFTTSGANPLTLTTTGTTNVTLPTSGTLYGTASNSITSSQLATSVSDETGTGSLVFGTSPSLTTPALSAATVSTSATVTAGTNAQGQGALTSDYNVITTAAANPSGVTLPTATAGRRVTIVNKGANLINVYPASGAQIDALGANISQQIPVNGIQEYIASSSTQWYSGANSVEDLGFVTGTLAIANGGTGATTKTTAFDALSPMTTLGDTIYGGASGTGTRLAGNTTTTKQFLSQTGTGSASAAPVWSALSAGDIPALAYLSSANNSTQSGYFGDIFLFDDSTPSHYLGITNSANLTAARTLSINVNDANRVLTFGGDLTTSGGAITLTATASTNVTLPTSGTLISSTNYIVRETPTGTVNGTNADFVLANTPVSGSEMVFVNGILQNAGTGDDYTMATATTIRFQSSPLDARPQSGDIIRVTYLRA